MDPEPLEGVLLQCLALLSRAPSSVTPVEAALTAAGFLLSFDGWMRGGDIVQQLTSELRPPRRGHSQFWTLNMFPSTHNMESKTHQSDVLIGVGESNPDRRWMSEVGTLLKNHRKKQHLLLGLLPSRYVHLFQLSRALAKLERSTPHRLRHGGASLDGCQTGIHRLSDVAMLERGSWTSIASLRAYRRPGRYMKVRDKLSAAQLRAAESVVNEILRILRTRLI